MKSTDKLFWRPIRLWYYYRDVLYDLLDYLYGQMGAFRQLLYYHHDLRCREKWWSTNNFRAQTKQYVAEMLKICLSLVLKFEYIEEEWPALQVNYHESGLMDTLGIIESRLTLTTSIYTGAHYWGRVRISRSMTVPLAGARAALLRMSSWVGVRDTAYKEINSGEWIRMYCIMAGVQKAMVKIKGTRSNCKCNMTEKSTILQIK